MEPMLNEIGYVHRDSPEYRKHIRVTRTIGNATAPIRKLYEVRSFIPKKKQLRILEISSSPAVSRFSRNKAVGKDCYFDMRIQLRLPSYGFVLSFLLLKRPKKVLTVLCQCALMVPKIAYYRAISAFLRRLKLTLLPIKHPGSSQ